MIRQIYKIENINDFEVKDNFVIALSGEILSRDLLVINAEIQQVTKLLDNMTLPAIKVFDSKLWVYGKGKTSEFEIVSSFSLSNLFIDFFPKSINGNLIIGDNKRGDMRFLEARELIEGSKKWQLDFTSTIYHISEQVYLVRFGENLEKSKIYAYKLENGLFSWAYIVPENKYDWYNLGSVYISERSIPIKAEIKKILGEFNEILWISLNSGRLLGLDIHTGGLRLDLAIPNNFYTHFPEEIKNFSSAVGSLLDEHMGVIFGLHLTYYWEIDLTDPENKYILYDISEQCDQNLNGGGEITQDLVWKNEEIFFYQWSFAQDPSYVGIFNRNTREITWTSRELGGDGIFKGVNKVDYCDKKLYVLDRVKTLHIFER